MDQRALANLQKRDKTPPPPLVRESPAPSKASTKVRNKEANDRRQSRKLLGELFIDKEYLENLLKHPDLKRADTKTENISAYAKDAIAFLNTRQEFWRQQKPTNILSSSKAIAQTIPQL